MKNLKPYIFYSNNILDKLSLFFKIGGIALFPVVIIRERYLQKRYLAKAKKLINHETIHFQQALELLVIPFYVIYVLEYIFKAIKYLDIEKAYYNISFEREAYANESNLNYLIERKRYNWLKLIF